MQSDIVAGDYKKKLINTQVKYKLSLQYICKESKLKHYAIFII